MGGGGQASVSPAPRALLLSSNAQLHRQESEVLPGSRGGMGISSMAHLTTMHSCSGSCLDNQPRLTQGLAIKTSSSMPRAVSLNTPSLVQCWLLEPLLLLPETERTFSYYSFPCRRVGTKPRPTAPCRSLNLSHSLPNASWMGL